MSSQSIETTLRIRKLILQARNDDPEKCVTDRAVNEAVRLVLELLGDDAFKVSEQTIRQRTIQ